jgi:uncharacterized protein YgbK (DUF1537 family)
MLAFGLEVSVPSHSKLLRRVGNKPMPQILIIADDLTGAADTGAAFANAGWLTLVILDPTSQTPEGDVLVVSTESRDMTQEEAAAQVRRAVHQIKSKGEIPYIYKKIDSTLRGHPGAELAAAMDALGQGQALVAPAFPAQGRTTVGGHQWVDEIPVEHTSFGNEVPCSDLLALFQTRCMIELNRVRRGPDAICEALDATRSEVVVTDAETDADLMTIARAGLRCGVRLWCGSAGLAWALAKALPRPDQAFIEHAPSKPPGSVLVVAGSRHARTVRQVEVAQGWGATVIRPVPGSLEGDSRAVERTVLRASRRLADDEHVILTTAGLDDAPVRSQVVADALAEMTRRLVAEGHAGGLVLTGGDIAAAVFAALGGSALWLRGETQSGIAWGILLGGLLPGLRVVTKAGGFGTDEALAVAIRRLVGWMGG